MTCWLDEVDTGVDSVINNVHSVDLVLRVKVGVEPLLNVLNDRPPRIIIVHKVTKAWCIHYCQTQADTVLLNISTY